MPTETVRGGPSYRADATWWLPLPLRRALLLTPPLALAVLEVFHPQPSPRQRQAMMVRGVLQVGLLAVALNDLRRRPASQIRGPKPLWAVISFANYLGVGPIAYFVLGRRWPVTSLRAGNGVGTRDMLALL